MRAEPDYKSAYDSPYLASPLARRLTPIPPDTPLSLKRSIEKIKIVGFTLPNGAQVKIKRELHPLLDQATDERGGVSRKYYSPTPQEDITYDTILVKETLEPVKTKNDLPETGGGGDLVLTQKKLLDTVPLGAITNSLVELESKAFRRDYLRSGGEVTLAPTDIDGASTDSEQPNLIGPLYHKKIVAASGSPMRIESREPITHYHAGGPRERKARLNNTFTLFKEIAERKRGGPRLPSIERQRPR